MCKKLSVLASRVSNFRSVMRRPERPPSVIPTSRVLWLVAFAVVWAMTGYGGIAVGQVAGVDDPSDMADSSGDIKRIEAWMDEGNLNLTMTVYGVFAPSVEDTPAGMTNRYYYHWLLDTDNNPATGYLNDEYEGNATNLQTPIGVDLLVQFGWRDGATNGVYAYTLDPLTGDEVELFEDYEYTIEGDTIHAVIPLADLGLTPDDIIAVSAFQEGASNGWQVDWIESFELTLEDTSVSAYNPDPADSAYYTGTWATLSWSPDKAAVSHDVYFGDNYDDVANGTGDTFRVNQGRDINFYIVGFPGYAYPDGLVPGTTYYWRIDEVNEADPRSPWKGDVWSFTIPPRTAYNPDPADGAEFVDPNAALSWTAGYGAKMHIVYLSDNYEDVNNAAGGTQQGPATYDPGTLKMAKTYYWRVDEFDAVETHKGGIWSFTTEGAVAALDPVNGAVDVTQTPILTWTPGLGATHEVYFGADAASLELKGSGNLGSESYEPGQLEWNTTYYWRINEANNANADSPWTGPLWSFTTANFLIIDDIESYNDIDEGEPGSNRIYNAWLDGFDDPTNGSQVGHLDPPFYEETIVHSGNKSMPLTYDNAVGKSEATLTLTSNRDWTVNGVDTLTIWFRGASGNAAEQMYVTLNGSARVDHDDPDAAISTSWKEWNIDLQAFADQGVNFANVNSITLGLSSVTGGTGMMYFDDIRLYPPEP